MKFSERMGETKVKSVIQIDSMDDDLKNSLWNVLYQNYFKIPDLTFIKGSDNEIFFNNIWLYYLKEPIDKAPHLVEKHRSKVREMFFSSTWYGVYDLLEFMIQNPGPLLFPRLKYIISEINKVLEVELSGYRIVENIFMPITDENQINEIQKAIDCTSKNANLKGINIHLKTAMEMLSNKTQPDYRNSIKESISAVESITKVISGKKTATLGEALKTIQNKGIIQIPKVLKEGFEKLYGYTNNEIGIRHALMDGPTIEQEDAIYMLVSCSAFINYLITKADKSNLQLL